eukprot:3455065-Rhodomonas_salina.1
MVGPMRTVGPMRMGCCMRMVCSMRMGSHRDNMNITCPAHFKRIINTPWLLIHVHVQDHHSTLSTVTKSTTLSDHIKYNSIAQNTQSITVSHGHQSCPTPASTHTHTHASLVRGGTRGGARATTDWQ